MESIEELLKKANEFSVLRKELELKTWEFGSRRDIKLNYSPIELMEKKDVTIKNRVVISNKGIVLNNVIHKNNYNFSGVSPLYLAPNISYINVKGTIENVLIISDDFSYADLILHTYNGDVYIILIGVKDTKYLYQLKSKFKDRLYIYIVGNHFNIHSFNKIKIILKDKKFVCIIQDYYKVKKYNFMQEFLAFALLLVNLYLTPVGSLILNSELYTPQYNVQKFTTIDKLYHLLFSSFNYFFLNNTGALASNPPCRDSLTHFDPNISKPEDLEFALNIIKNNTGNLEDNIIKPITDHNLDHIPRLYAEYMYQKWRSCYNIIVQEMEYVHKTPILSLSKQGGSLENLSTYRAYNVSIQNYPFPTTVDDIKKIVPYNEDTKVFSPRCHWGQKKLLLSEIQFLTEICKLENKPTLEEYCVVYVGSADGTHLTILYAMFPELNWILYDPNPFHKLAYIHPRIKEKSVIVHNKYFLDSTIPEVIKQTSRKILFISDIRVAPKEEQISQDMKSQARWGIQLKSVYMLLKFRIPYDLHDKNLILNPEQFITPINNFTNLETYLPRPGPDYFLYLEGKIYLQLYPPSYSIETRLFVTKPYNLKWYNCKEIEGKLSWFNNQIRCKEVHIVNNNIKLIPGYDMGFESVVELGIIENYLQYCNFPNNLQSILIEKVEKPNKIDRTVLDTNIVLDKSSMNTVKYEQSNSAKPPSPYGNLSVILLFDLNVYLEKLCYRYLIDCNYRTQEKNLKNRNTVEKNLQDIWIHFDLICKQESILYQIYLLKKIGSQILGNRRTQIAIKFLESRIDHKLHNKYIIIDNDCKPKFI